MNCIGLVKKVLNAGTVNEKEVIYRCGKCYYCANRRINEWVLRLRKEEEASTSSTFVTLTYDTEFVPITQNGFMTLDKEDLQKFFKRLRKNDKNTNIKYYAAGEYGSIRNRPHYHIILFNVKDHENIYKSWKKGTIHIGTVTSESIAYTAKYINKSNFEKKHERDDRKKEFSLKSTGLGKSYLTDKIKRYHNEEITRVPVLDERRMPLPRYYSQRIFDDETRKKRAEIIIEKVAETNEKRKKSLSMNDNEYQQLVNKEVINKQLKHERQSKKARPVD